MTRGTSLVRSDRRELPLFFPDDWDRVPATAPPRKANFIVNYPLMTIVDYPIADMIPS